MLTWADVLEFGKNGNPTIERKLMKSEDEWRESLTDEQYRVTRKHGTERAFSSDMCNRFEPGRYACVCCGTLLFDSAEKFDSGTGWPSFTQPVQENVVAYNTDTSHGMTRVETVCNVCDAHLGHVFPDGPEPSGLRYCINAVALQKEENSAASVTFGGGCFWCTEAIFQRIKGVTEVTSGYSGGDVQQPTYNQVCTGSTGHAEVIQVKYDPEVVSFGEIVRVHLGTHNPTTLNQQGADRGTQYRSVIFYQNEEEKSVAGKLIQEMEAVLGKPVVTEVAPLDTFYPAEQEHQNYYNRNNGKPYCFTVIDPKLAKFREHFPEMTEASPA
ncbi:Peptide methionine sulfoxide reductase MsrA [Polystyrenella longa]|uniref:Multifunctional fusion protein n=1 Tax=Polystyrenella longa TaxID=2528007 RepID=A0A518CSS8_9PLAN|nr:bifunctional methionine sulfoxide reductase B/A protein [Polystyrenella longa]QDU82287.1 Peptide methionine sulfoxide reductase MsrA [Polystyrenella longa]